MTILKSLNILDANEYFLVEPAFWANMVERNILFRFEENDKPELISNKDQSNIKYACYSIFDDLLMKYNQCEFSFHRHTHSFYLDEIIIIEGTGVQKDNYFNEKQELLEESEEFYHHFFPFMRGHTFKNRNEFAAYSHTLKSAFNLKKDYDKNHTFYDEEDIVNKVVTSERFTWSYLVNVSDSIANKDDFKIEKTNLVQKLLPHYPTLISQLF